MVDQYLLKKSISVPSLPSLRSKLLKVLALHVRRAHRLLDIGCGDGSLTVEVAKLIGADEVYGIDISKEGLMASAQKGIIVREVDLNYDKIPFPNNYFDLVMAIEVIEHLLNIDNLLEEAWRVLKIGGFFVLSTPNMCSYANRVLLMLGYLPVYYEVSQKWRVGKPWGNRTRFNAVGHVRLYNLRAIKDLLEVNGFRLIKAYGVSIYQRNKLINVVDEIFAHIPSLASGIIVLAKKQIAKNTGDPT